MVGKFNLITRPALGLDWYSQDLVSFPPLFSFVSAASIYNQGQSCVLKVAAPHPRPLGPYRYPGAKSTSASPSPCLTLVGEQDIWYNLSKQGTLLEWLCGQSHQTAWLENLEYNMKQEEDSGYWRCSQLNAIGKLFSFLRLICLLRGVIWRSFLNEWLIRWPFTLESILFISMEPYGNHNLGLCKWIDWYSHPPPFSWIFIWALRPVC